VGGDVGNGGTVNNNGREENLVGPGKERQWEEMGLRAKREGGDVSYMTSEGESK